ncbi:hypothetical protein A2U01_0030111, partial [Trifolium medium]|nr:hypothetical protein [Trifolium medium]
MSNNECSRYCVGASMVSRMHTCEDCQWRLTFMLEEPLMTCPLGICFDLWISSGITILRYERFVGDVIFGHL